MIGTEDSRGTGAAGESNGSTTSHRSGEILQVADQYYVLATSVLADHDTRVLKQGETFAIFDSYGDVQPVTHSESGLFHRGTRYLSKLEFTIHGDQRPLLLNSTLRDDNGILKVDMTNRDLTLPSEGFFPKGTLYINREKYLLDSRCMERVEIVNYGARDVEINGAYRVNADFADIFEVRGTKRARHGTVKVERLAHGETADQEVLLFTYEGLDGIRRQTTFCLQGLSYKVEELASQVASGVADQMVRFRLKVAARSKAEFFSSIVFHEADEALKKTEFKAGLRRIHDDHCAGRQRYCGIRTSNDQFDAWMRRSTDDLVMMTTQTSEGYLYPYAGIPWFCTPFGRDGLLTAMQCLWANPQLASGVLQYLAETQAEEKIADRDATPGKIIHEARDGEMANLKEIPFGRYYGSVDSTPLFVCLGGAYYTRTNDLALIRKLWPAFEKAIMWMSRYGDVDGDGFIEYARENPNGLVQQGWKDSSDSVFHEDGSDAKGPIALCEVQGYCYMAYVEGAKMAAAVGHADLAQDLKRRADELRKRFDEAFWQDDLGTYALALDGKKRPCRVKSSNAGQCLFTGIVREERAAKLVATLMDEKSFSGWGVRTIATDSARYNPMSYHNGSVWPHDVSLIAWGMAKHGFTAEAEKLFTGLFRSATYMEQMRMPEVFCGFDRRAGEAPTLYPHACSPQAWAAGSVYMMIQSLLGLSIDAVNRTVNMRYPRLPEWMESLKISDLHVSMDAEPGAAFASSVDLTIQNYHNDVSVQLVRRTPGVKVTVEK